MNDLLPSHPTPMDHRYKHISSTHTAEATASPKRQKPARQNSDLLPSYYESSIPNQGYARSPSPERKKNKQRHHARKPSTHSTSSSDYSEHSDAGAETSASVTKRQNVPSKGGADRRRVAIMQMDTPEDTPSPKPHHSPSSDHDHDTASATGSIRQRRGYKNDLSGLALVAPPDAALRSYTHLTPPSTAPISSDGSNHSLLTAGGNDRERGHHRSASEIAHSKNLLSRHGRSAPVGSQGTTSRVSDLQYSGSGASRSSSTKADRDGTTTAQHPNVSLSIAPPSPPAPPRSSSPTTKTHPGQSLLSPPYSGYPSASMIDMFSPVVTPEIGEGKEIHMPVAAPVVVDLQKASQYKKSSMVYPRAGSPTRSSGSNGKAAHPHSASATSVYQSYVPGSTHTSAAGSPLPPPRTAIEASSPPPPRPPRLHSPAPPRTRGDLDSVKQALQLPPSVTAALSSSSSPRMSSTKSIESEKEADTASVEENINGGSRLVKSRSVHRREGATVAPLSSSTESASASSASPSPRTPSPKSSVAQPSLEEPTPKQFEGLPRLSTGDPFGVPVTLIEPPTPAPPVTPSHQKPDVGKFDQWLSDNPQFARPPELHRGNSYDSSPRRTSYERPLSPMSADHTGEAPSPPPKSFRHSISNNLKRFSSVKRASSLSSKSARRTSGGTHYSSRTPSPRPLSMDSQPDQGFKKIRSLNPAALYCHEVYGQNTTLQRCAIYAAKINELYLYDCGLSDWVADMKNPSLHSQGPRGPSSKPFTHQPRHTSRSSMLSEATFPRRPDATTATDLSTGAYDSSPTGMPPKLPYPSLALNPPRSAPARSMTSIGSSGTPPSSIRSLAPSLTNHSKPGFFASLGRKASLSKKERPVISSPISTTTTGTGGGVRLPVKTLPISSPTSAASASKTNLNISRPIQITSPPTVPGGPRAPPQRAKRSQTFMSSVSPTSPIGRGGGRGDDPLGRRPSLFDLNTYAVIDIKPDPEFAKQVDKLAALIPRAEKNVLAGYLRRAGSDMLAIGQYLEDERMGTIRLH